MIVYSAEAIDHIDALRLYYVDKNRLEAAVALERALEQAEQAIALQPLAGLLAPRPYPSLAAPDRRWTKAGRYWIAYKATSPAVILGVFYESANIPGRI